MHGFVSKIGLFCLILLTNSRSILLSGKLASIIIKAISVFQVWLLVSSIEHMFKEILLVVKFWVHSGAKKTEIFLFSVSLWHYASGLTDNQVQFPGNFSVVILCVILHFWLDGVISHLEWECLQWVLLYFLTCMGELFSSISPFWLFL